LILSRYFTYAFTLFSC